LPPFDEVSTCGAELERLVGDLIAVVILDGVSIVPLARIFHGSVAEADFWGGSLCGV